MSFPGSSRRSSPAWKSTLPPRPTEPRCKGCARRSPSAFPVAPPSKSTLPSRKRRWRWLVDELFRCDNPFTCPHGRPITLPDKHRRRIARVQKNLVPTCRNTTTFVGSATEARLRRDDESMRKHRRGGTTKRWARPAPTLRADGGCGRSLCRSSSTILPHRLLLSSRPHLARPIRKRHRISASQVLESETPSYRETWNLNRCHPLGLALKECFSLVVVPEKKTLNPARAQPA